MGPSRGPSGTKCGPSGAQVRTKWDQVGQVGAKWGPSGPGGPGGPGGPMGYPKNVVFSLVLISFLKRKRKWPHLPAAVGTAGGDPL